MTREEMIDAAVRDYLEYIDSVTGVLGHGRYWAALCNDAGHIHEPQAQAIRFAYWLIKCGEETFGP